MVDNSNDNPKIKAELMTVYDLLHEAELVIPPYQRPYKWSTKNAVRLIDDIQEFRRFETYRIGTVIVYSKGDSESLEVIDGQQRIITFTLMARALKEILRDDASDDLVETTCEQHLKIPAYNSGASIENIQKNHNAIKERLRNLGGVGAIKQFSSYFLRNCTVLLVRTFEQSDAFQLFDSQNSRGKDLDPTDLLKAFHLREMDASGCTVEQKQEAVGMWEGAGAERIHALFGEYLYRIIKWSENERVDRNGFTKDEIGLFEGVSIANGNAKDNRARLCLYALGFVDHLNSIAEAPIGAGLIERCEYPFQIDQPIINGDLFFKMTEHYLRLFESCGCLTGEEAAEDPASSHMPLSHDIIKKLNDIKSPVARDAVRYSRNVFDCLLVYYVDRYGYEGLDTAIPLIFKYAFFPRFDKRTLQFKSIDKYICDNNEEANRFSLLRRSRSAFEFTQAIPHIVRESDFKKDEFPRGVRDFAEGFREIYFTDAADNSDSATEEGEQ